MIPSDMRINAKSIFNTLTQTMTPNPTRDSQSDSDNESLHDDLPSPNAIKDSAAYAKNRVTEDLHPAFEGSGFRYDTSSDRFAAESEEVYDGAALCDSQKAFSNALEQFQQGVKPKYKSQIDLRATHTWKEVMEYADEARKKYTGVDQKGILKKIDHGLKTFQTAAPAIEAWLKLLPSTSIYGSVVCGGVTIILEVRIHSDYSQQKLIKSRRQSISRSSERRP